MRARAAGAEYSVSTNRSASALVPPEFTARDFTSGVLFRNGSSGPQELAVVGGEILDLTRRTLDDIWVINLETRAWRLASMKTPVPVSLKHPSCAWDRDDSIYCYGLAWAVGMYAEDMPSYFWKHSISTQQTHIIPTLPANNFQRGFQCTTFYAGSFWMATGSRGWSGLNDHGSYNDLLRFSPSSQNWTVEIENGNTDMYPRFRAACGQLGSRWYFCGYAVTGGTTDSDVFYVDLAAPTKRWTYLTDLGYLKHDGASIDTFEPCGGLFILTSYRLNPNETPGYVLLNPVDGAVEHLHRGIPNPSNSQFVYPFSNQALAVTAVDTKVQTTCKFFAAGSSYGTYGFVEATVTVPAATATWSAPSTGQAVQRGSILRAVWSSASRTFGPAAVVLAAANESIPPSEHVLVAWVTVARSGGSFNVTIPLGVNAGSYRLRLDPASGVSMQTPAFTIPSWNLLELSWSSWDAGYEIWSNTSITVSWTAAAWPFPLEAHLLPSRRSTILSWTGFVLGRSNVLQTSAGEITLELPANTTGGDYVIRLVDASVPTILSHTLTKYFVVNPTADYLRPLA
eukprot:tig00000145_g8806.t1